MAILIKIGNTNMKINKDLIFEKYTQVDAENNSLTLLAFLCHDIAQSKGWWDSGEREFSGIIALCHSELSEAYDYLLKTLETGEEQFDDHLPEHSGFITELADTVIRVFDWTEWRGLDVDKSIRDAWSGDSERFEIGSEITCGHITNTFVLSAVRSQGFVFLGKCHSYLSQALEIDRKEFDKDKILKVLTRLVIDIVVHCENWFGKGVLESVILQKLNYNMHRAPLHGKKY